ncbi:MAG: hypothetical protein AAF891_00460 [Pseudomonadota bacterium]
MKHGTPHGQHSGGKTVKIEWKWGTNSVVDFNPATDKIDFGWFTKTQINVTERGGNLIIEIPSNKQSYTLRGARLSNLNASNIIARDGSTKSAMDQLVGGGRPTTPVVPTTPSQPTTPTPTTPGAGPSQPDPKPTTPTTPTTPAPNPGTPAPVGGGRVFSMNTGGADITGFDVTKDKINTGHHSVHSFIIVDTAAGVGFRSPWGAKSTQYLRGVRLADLSVNNFTSIGNNHLREDVSGALAWEKGIKREPNTVYLRTHEVGQVDKVNFNPATDKVSFLYASSRELFSLKDGAEGVEITNGATNQKLILKGVKKSQLSANNFRFHFSQVREDHLDQQIGFTVSNAQIVNRNAIPTAGAGGGAAGSRTPAQQSSVASLVVKSQDMQKRADAAARTPADASAQGHQHAMGNANNAGAPKHSWETFVSDAPVHYDYNGPLTTAAQDLAGMGTSATGKSTRRKAGWDNSGTLAM